MYAELELHAILDTELELHVILGSIGCIMGFFMVFLGVLIFYFIFLAVHVLLVIPVDLRDAKTISSNYDKEWTRNLYVSINCNVDINIPFI